ncbi:hypothetical protein AGMMS50212_05170 [Spirochaetia bacterium]|nr:hypothetical protein AGMMS50212_05170 [Spirochaetia bacterium]
MGIIFLCLFCLSAIINITAIFLEKYFVRTASKLCLMPLLIFFTIFQSFSSFQSNEFSIIILLALLFSWFGDIFLIKPDKIKLYLGIISFLISHILYIIVYNSFISDIKILFYVLSFAGFFIIEYFIIKRLHFPRGYKIPTILYGIVIGHLILFSLQVFAGNRNIYSFLLVAGSIFFLISDTVLVYYNTVKTMTKYGAALVMASYVIAQAGIIIACVNLPIALNKIY